MAYVDKVIAVIDEYIEPNKHLLALNRIHRNVFNENKDFDSFSEARKQYRKREWTREGVQAFAAESKRVVDGGDGRISETYFSIVKPENASLETIEKELSRNEYNPDKEGEGRAGFDFDVVDDFIDGRYVYVDVDTQLSYSGSVNRIVDEGALEFLILPKKNLWILQSTSVIDVQKTKSIVAKKTDLAVTVAGDLTLFDHQDAAERIDNFRNSFANPDEEGETDEPILLEVNDIKLEKPKGKEADDSDQNEMKLTNIDFGGTDIAEHPKVRQQIDEGWIIKRITASVHYDEEVMLVTAAGTSVMGYAKVENFQSRPRARELMDNVRSRYLKHIAYTNEPTSSGQ